MDNLLVVAAALSYTLGGYFMKHAAASPRFCPR